MDVRPILLEGLPIFLRFAVIAAEVKDAQIPRGIPNDPVEIFEDEQRHVPVVVLEGLVADTGALVGGEFESFGFWLLGGIFHRRLVVLEERFVFVRPFAVGTAVRKHLENAEIETNLDPPFAVIPKKLPDVGLSGNEGPSSEEGREVVGDPVCLFFVWFFWQF